MYVTNAFKVGKRFKALCRILEKFYETGKFELITESWNPVTGCLHECTYCWAKRLANERLKDSRRYREGFKPRLNREEFKRRFRGGVVFITDMGDLFGDFIPKDWILTVLRYVRRFSNTFFLFLTKNPKRYFEFIDEIPGNVILGATVETDKDEIYKGISKAPRPSERIEAMKKLEWEAKYLSIEPILDFSPRFVEEIEEINPFAVYIGYDNYGNRLPEPRLDKTLSLIKELRERGFLILKGTLRRAWYE